MNSSHFEQLFPRKTREEKQNTVMSSSRGQGQLDLYAVLGNNQNAFQVRMPERFLPKRRVYFCDAFYKKLDLIRKEIFIKMLLGFFREYERTKDYGVFFPSDLESLCKNYASFTNEQKMEKEEVSLFEMQERLRKAGRGGDSYDDILLEGDTFTKILSMLPSIMPELLTKEEKAYCENQSVDILDLTRFPIYGKENQQKWQAVKNDKALFQRKRTIRFDNENQAMDFLCGTIEYIKEGTEIEIVNYEGHFDTSCFPLKKLNTLQITLKLEKEVIMEISPTLFSAMHFKKCELPRFNVKPLKEGQTGVLHTLTFSKEGEDVPIHLVWESPVYPVRSLKLTHFYFPVGEKVPKGVEHFTQEGGRTPLFEDPGALKSLILKPCELDNWEAFKLQLETMVNLELIVLDITNERVLGEVDLFLDLEKNPKLSSITIAHNFLEDNARITVNSLPSLQSMRCLSLGCYHSMRDIDLSRSDQLKSLRLNMEGAVRLPNKSVLEELALTAFTRVEDNGVEEIDLALEGLENSIALKSLSLQESLFYLKKYPVLEEVTYLEIEGEAAEVFKENISFYCSNIVTLSLKDFSIDTEDFFSFFKSLKNVFLENMHIAADNLKGFSLIEKMEIASCSFNKGFFRIEDALSLTELKLIGDVNSNMKAGVQGIQLMNVPHLKSLTLSQCHFLKELPVEDLSALQSLILIECNLKGSSKLPALEHLKIICPRDAKIATVGEEIFCAQYYRDRWDYNKKHAQLRELELEMQPSEVLNFDLFPRLQVLKMNNNCGVYGNEALGLVNNAPHLLGLTLCDTKGSSFQINAVNMPNLVWAKLSASNVNKVDLSPLENLEIGDVENCHDLQLTAEKCQALRVLKVKNVFRATLSHAPYLTDLAVVNESNCGEGYFDLKESKNLQNVLFQSVDAIDAKDTAFEGLGGCEALQNVFLYNMSKKHQDAIGALIKSLEHKVHVISENKIVAADKMAMRFNMNEKMVWLDEGGGEVGETYSGRGNFLCEIVSEYPIPAYYQRQRVFNKIGKKNGRICFFRDSSEDEKHYKRISFEASKFPSDIRGEKTKLRKQKGAAHIFLEGELKAGRYYFLPSHITLPFEEHLKIPLYVNRTVEMELYWHDVFHQYAVRFKSSSVSYANIKVIFPYSLHRDYNRVPESRKVMLSERSLLPDSLNQSLPFILNTVYERSKDKEEKLSKMDTGGLTEKERIKHAEEICYLKKLNEFLDAYHRSPPEKWVLILKGLLTLFQDKELGDLGREVIGDLKGAISSFMSKDEEGNAEEFHDECLIGARLLMGVGVCRHRAEIYQLLVHLKGGHVNMWRNDLHGWCDTLYQVENADAKGSSGHSCHASHVGGGISNDNTPTALLQFSLGSSSDSADEKNVVKSNLSERKEARDGKTESAPLTKEEEYMECYVQVFSKRITGISVNSLEEFLEQQEKQEFKSPPLLRLSAQQTSRAVNAMLRKLLKAKGVDLHERCLTIRSAKQFRQFIKTYHMNENTGHVDDNVEGPFVRLKKKSEIEPVYILIDWTRFSPDEVLEFQYLLEPQQINKNFHLIGMANEKTTTCESFSSRCQPVTLKNAIVMPPLEEKKKESREPLIVNAFKRKDWFSFLFGIPHEDGLTEGPLLQAIRENRPLHILNPPEDKGFKELLEEISDGSLFFNGKSIQVPLGPNQITTAIFVSDEPVKNLIVDQSIDPSKTLREIGLYNIHELYEQRTVLPDGGLKTNLNGLLGSHNPVKEVFYITCVLPQEDWDRLKDHIKTHYPQKEFHVAFAPDAGIGAPKDPSNPLPLDEKTIPSVVLTNDSDLMSLDLKKQLDSERPTLIIDVTPDMDFGQLIGCQYTKIVEEKDAKKVKLAYQETPFLKMLETHNVILNGELSDSLYQQLIALIHGKPPRRMYPNGEDVRELKENTGRLIAVMPKNKRTVYSKIESHEKAFDYQKDYRPRFSEEDRKWADMAYQYHQMASALPSGGRGQPPAHSLSMKWLERMVLKLKEQKESNFRLHPQNPIKGLILYDYPKESLQYAYLNVRGKMLFRPDNPRPLRIEKLKGILKKFSIKTIEEMKPHVWKLLNCFSGKELVSFLKEEDICLTGSVPSLSETAWSSLGEKICALLSEKKSDSKNENAPLKKGCLIKEDIQFKTLITDKNVLKIFLKGPAGVGKTTIAKKLKKEMNYELYEGDKGFKTWLTRSHPDKPCILLVDEANKFSPDTWNYLKGLSRDGKTLCTPQGTFPLSDRHKIVFTGNPEDYEDRLHDLFLQHYTETLYFKMPSKKELMHIMLSALGDDKKSVAALLWDAYRLAKKMNPTYIYSLRDIEKVMEQFKKHPLSLREPLKAALESAFDRFVMTLSEEDKRNEYRMTLSTKYGLSCEEALERPQKALLPLGPLPVPPKEQKYFPKEKENMLRLMRNTLEHRRDALDGKKEGVSYERFFLIEGDSGFGKSTTCEEVLKEYGFSENASDPQKKYYLITWDSGGKAEKIILKAFHKGSGVVLGEPNNKSKNNQPQTDGRFETLVDQLITKGEDFEGNPPKIKGFVLFASQNLFGTGRKATPLSLRNRGQMMYATPFSDLALEGIAAQKVVLEPHVMGEVYRRLKRLYGPEMNMRIYYESLDEVREAGVKLQKSREATLVFIKRTSR